jgi:RNA recognition motif-containing protein
MSEPTDETKPTVAQEEQKEEEEDDEEDLEKLQAEIERMEAEAARITQETQDIEKGEGASNSAATKADSIKRDGCSIYVGQVDYSATPEELLAHFEACGTVERVTIVCDKMTGKPKGMC